MTLLWELFERSKPKVVVEIGVAQGGTFAGWCVLAPDDALLIGIDRDLNDARPRPNEPVHPSIYNGPLRDSERGGGIYSLRQRSQTVRGISGWSTEEKTFSQLMDILDGRKIDFLFCDSSHERSMFRKEFDMYFPLVAEGGIYATHDVQKSSHPDVTKWQEWEVVKATAEYSACYEYLGGRNDDSYGLGCLLK